MEIFEEWVKTSKSETNAAVFKLVASKHVLSGVTEPSIKEMKMAISRFTSKLSERWKKSRRTLDRFLASNKTWLEGDIQFHTIKDDTEPSTSSQLRPVAGPGRPKIVNLEDVSSRTKRRRVDDLIQSLFLVLHACYCAQDTRARGGCYTIGSFANRAAFRGSLGRSSQ